ncbi:MAG TPA: ATP-binding protein, partial [Candidatus Thalassarchaeaceae archaeon]
PKRRREGIIGPAPESIDVHGRSSEIQTISDSVMEGKSIVISGLPGIGKSTLARAIATNLENNGWTIRWAKCSVSTDTKSIGDMWLGKPSPSSVAAIIESVASSRTLLVIDEAQELHPRHSKPICELISEASES